MGKYTLKCLACEKEYEDDFFRLECDNRHVPSLLRTVYEKDKINVKEDRPGMFKFEDFLPVSRTLDVKGAPVTYRSEQLAKYLGLENLFIIFNGYWPEKGAYMETASFKELEAPSVLGRIPENCTDTIVVASAGNTGRAFAYVCSRNHIPLVLVVPEENKDEIWSTEPYNSNVRLVCAGGNSDYTDAIKLAGKIIELKGFFPEGGAKNVARRDGMATTVLDAAHRMRRIPDHYFQAVGSGTGGIAAWESYVRLREDGGYGDGKMTLHLSQNAPFTPITDAWNDGQRSFPELDEKRAKEDIRQIKAHVLSNRKPPYSIKGGVFDVMSDSSGRMYSVTNEEVIEAQELFAHYEKIDIHPAAGVALGSLIQAKEQNLIRNHDHIALNVTGGGENRVKNELQIHFLEPLVTFTDEEIHCDGIEEMLQDILVAY
jgi:cysteate synthase